jgi:hypothetical protein
MIVGGTDYVHSSHGSSQFTSGTGGRVIQSVQVSYIILEIILEKEKVES